MRILSFSRAENSKMSAFELFFQVRGSFGGLEESAWEFWRPEGAREALAKVQTRAFRAFRGPKTPK